MLDSDTIIAQASPPGRGGVSLIRLSGSKSLKIAADLFHKENSFFKERLAQFVNCYSEQELIDEGLSLYFKAPKSFTGEDVVEFQCHGSPIVVDKVIDAALKQGARLANPGEFSERAFLNGKIDLVQAEAIADLIDSQSQQAAKNAVQTLKGLFSKRIEVFNETLIQVRMYLEAAIDFPDEEGVDFISEGKILEKVQNLKNQLITIRSEAEQGHILNEGLSVVLAGEPNAGKSSLLNVLAQRDSAIVTDIAGTTRDVLKEQISLDGLALNIIDTAGLRQTDDPVEQEGVRRAWLEIESADLILYLVDTRTVDSLSEQGAWLELQNRFDKQELSQKSLIVENKIDITNHQAGENEIDIDQVAYSKIAISAKNHLGIDLLKDKIKLSSGLSGNQESKFSARRRHIYAIDQSLDYLYKALEQLENRAPELVAEDLRLAHKELGEITGEFSSDDLLGEIFSGFCIGK